MGSQHAGQKLNSKTKRQECDRGEEGAEGRGGRASLKHPVAGRIGWLGAHKEKGNKEKIQKPLKYRGN